MSAPMVVSWLAWQLSGARLRWLAAWTNQLAPASEPGGDTRRIPRACGPDRAPRTEWRSGCTQWWPWRPIVPLPSANHILLAEEPAWNIFREELASFL